jgi:digeranylgeranylglycerophospholipid reductase
MKTHDIAVIGGGPVGSYTAYRMADLGFDVALFEKDAAIGSDVVCTGIVGAEAFRKHDLPMRSILYKMNSVSFFSPSGEELDYTSSEPFAYVIDRGVFDRGIFRKAADRGVTVHVGTPVTGITTGLGHCRVIAEGHGTASEIRAKAVVLATGVHYGLHRLLGLGRPPAFLFALQTVTRMPGLEKPEIYLNDLTHGSFAWVVPCGNGQARIGALTRTQDLRELTRFVRARVAESDRTADAAIAHKPIAHGLVDRTVGDRVIAVGEAAGQIKTTTGGGIYYGLMCADVAVGVLQSAFRRGDLSAAGLCRYEKAWRSRIAKDIRTGCEVRRLMEHLDPDHIDSLFRLIRRSRPLRGLIRGKVNFDHQTDLLLLGMKLVKPFLRKSRSGCAGEAQAGLISQPWAGAPAGSPRPAIIASETRSNSSSP